MTNAQLAALYRTTKTTICRWRKEGAPLGDETEMADWLASRHHAPDGSQPTLAAARLEKMTFEGKRARLIYEREKRAVVPISEVQSDIQQIAVALQRRLNLLPDEAVIWSGLSPEQAHERARRFVRECYETFHDLSGKLYEAA